MEEEETYLFFIALAGKGVSSALYEQKPVTVPCPGAKEMVGKFSHKQPIPSQNGLLWEET
jgi:hypothetical protein